MSMTIGQLAAAGGVGVETVRYYQRRGLIDTPARPGALGGGVRRYDAGAVARLRFVRAAQAAGFLLEQIGELLALDEVADRDRIRALAQERIGELDRRIAALAHARDALAGLARRCDAAGAGACPIVAAFSG